MTREPLSPEDYASRISAYVYGNILVLTALVPLNNTSVAHAGFVVIGTGISTFIAHAFAESVGRSTRSGRSLTRIEKLEELRDSVPVLTSALIPAMVVGMGGLGWIDLSTALLLAEIWVVTRIAGITYVITRLRGERPNRGTLAASITLSLVAIAIVGVKLLLTH
ncbi:hypothetical protein [Rhodococcus sp. NPDC059234]|uniref:hypothetical protein n=1 Tax=Rhodococcus sp. NPDC059234 TaxID=3346781 RepID=UPI00366FDBD6